MVIAVLLHRKTRRRNLCASMIFHLAQTWRQDGHEVVFGTDRFVSADVCIVHVDLSVVPDEYREFASRYPVSVNSRVTDIRKRSFSHNLLTSSEDHKGPVIVKSDENFAGWPELLISWPYLTMVVLKMWASLRLPSSRFLSLEAYRIYQDIKDVPARYFVDDYFVVEKFLPEMIDGIYYLNMYIFCGDCEYCIRIGSNRPVVKATEIKSRILIEPHPGTKEIRQNLTMEYGKLDYCMHDGKLILIDVNKTDGLDGIDNLELDWVRTKLQERARGLYSLVQ